LYLKKKEEEEKEEEEEEKEYICFNIFFKYYI